MHDLVHSYGPHTSTGLYELIVVSIALALFLTLLVQWRMKTKIGLERWLTIGFAASPLPMYILLPVAPFDEHIIPVLFDEKVMLILAAFSGFAWTAREIRRLMSAGD
jgi:hypothetical protein